MWRMGGASQPNMHCDCNPQPHSRHTASTTSLKSLPPRQSINLFPQSTTNSLSPQLQPFSCPQDPHFSFQLFLCEPTPRVLASTAARHAHQADPGSTVFKGARVRLDRRKPHIREADAAAEAYLARGCGGAVMGGSGGVGFVIMLCGRVCGTVGFALPHEYYVLCPTTIKMRLCKSTHVKLTRPQYGTAAFSR